MDSISAFILSVKNSRKRTGLAYCDGLFSPIVDQFKIVIPEICIIDCAEFFTNSLIFSPKELLDKIEDESKGRTMIVANLETFIVSNSSGFKDEIARLLTSREPIKPVFFFFYSKKLFSSFRDIYKSKELNHYNIIEL
jgi:hypothetical protein